MVTERPVFSTFESKMALVTMGMRYWPLIFLLAIDCSHSADDRVKSTGPPVSVEFCGETWPVETTQLICMDKSLPSEEACKQAINNVRRVTLATEFEAEPVAMIRSCRRRSNRNVVECMRLAKTAQDLEACEGEALKTGDTPVTDLGALAKLTNLERLELVGTQVTDLGPLAKLTKLKELHLESTLVPESKIDKLQRELQIEKLQRDLPNLQILR